MTVCVWMPGRIANGAGANGNPKNEWKKEWTKIKKQKKERNESNKNKDKKWGKKATCDKWFGWV